MNVVNHLASIEALLNLEYAVPVDSRRDMEAYLLRFLSAEDLRFVAQSRSRSTYVLRFMRWRLHTGTRYMVLHNSRLGQRQITLEDAQLCARLDVLFETAEVGGHLLNQDRTVYHTILLAAPSLLVPTSAATGSAT